MFSQEFLELADNFVIKWPQSTTKLSTNSKNSCENIVNIRLSNGKLILSNGIATAMKNNLILRGVSISLPGNLKRFFSNHTAAFQLGALWGLHESSLTANHSRELPRLLCWSLYLWLEICIPTNQFHWNICLENLYHSYQLACLYDDLSYGANHSPSTLHTTSPSPLGAWTCVKL